MTVAHPAILTSDPPRLDQIVLGGVGDCAHGEDCGDGVHRGVPVQRRTIGSAAVMAGAALALVPWFAFYLRLDRRGRSTALQRDRVVVVSRPDEISDFQFEFKEAERPVVLVDFMSPEQVDADVDDLSSWTVTDCPRIAPFGRFLRSTHTDELPQAIDAFAGALLIVGRRPQQLHYVEKFSSKLPFCNTLHLVLPGCTGWTPVKCGYAGHEGNVLQKVKYECFHLHHQGLVFDARILAGTARSVLTRSGR